MHPIILERDTDVVDWTASNATLSTIESDPEDENIRVASRGTLGIDFEAMRMSILTGTITARRMRAAGLHITGPESGAELTPYAVSVNCICVDETLLPFLFMGSSPATITADATGDVVTDIHILAAPLGIRGTGLQREFVVVVEPRAGDEHLCFGIAFVAGVGASLNDAVIAHIAVRRLIGLDPAIIDARKL